MKTKIEIIDETVKFYKDRPRSMDSLACLYTSIVKGKKTHCAVGRCFLPKHKNKKFEYNEDAVKCLNKSVGLDSLLKEEYRGHDIEFWINLQKLHDGDSFWDKIDGSCGQNLSCAGKKRVKELKEEYKN